VSERAEAATHASGAGHGAELTAKERWVVEMRGLEPLTPAMRTRCSSS
jgi:hypothetical protein